MVGTGACGKESSYKSNDRRAGGGRGLEGSAADAGRGSKEARYGGYRFGFYALMRSP